ncbi:MAG: tryptophan synthase subunit alpha [Candidatus Omnitrophica bacterium]|nr:tryptophan synthase subunit alpha [Candidatus Omnitrophota bacterium]
MNRIDAKFSELRKARKKAFVAFITAGDPSLRATEVLVPALGEAGADIIELGVPFSDPLADGATIQAASQRALKQGVTLRKILRSVASIRKSSDVPIALMTYYNPVHHFGVKAFVSAARGAGVDGVIIPDLPVEESGELRSEALRQGLSTIFFLAPTTDPVRIPGIVKASTGFIYFVSVAGVTGARTELPADLVGKIRLAKSRTDKPVCVGFGISAPGQVRALGKVADGVIVGSAIVQEICRHAGRRDMPERVASLVRRLSSAL